MYMLEYSSKCIQIELQQRWNMDSHEEIAEFHDWDAMFKIVAILDMMNICMDSVWIVWK